MSWPCKRLRLSAGDDSNNDDSDDKAVVVASMTADVSGSFNVDVAEDTSQTADEIDISLTPELKPTPTTIDLTIDTSPCQRNTRQRAFPHTAEVIKARCALLANIRASNIVLGSELKPKDPDQRRRRLNSKGTGSCIFPTNSCEFLVHFELTKLRYFTTACYVFVNNSVNF